MDIPKFKAKLPVISVLAVIAPPNLTLLSISVKPLLAVLIAALFNVSMLPCNTPSAANARVSSALTSTVLASTSEVIRPLNKASAANARVSSALTSTVLASTSAVIRPLNKASAANARASSESTSAVAAAALAATAALLLKT